MAKTTKKAAAKKAGRVRVEIVFKPVRVTLPWWMADAVRVLNGEQVIDEDGERYTREQAQELFDDYLEREMLFPALEGVRALRARRK